MKAAFALLANSETHNFVRKIAREFHQGYGASTRHASLPPHISLKQPFHISDLSTLEEHMDELAECIAPFEATLTEVKIVPLPFNGMEYGILWIDVEETEALRGLHNRLDKELNQRFGTTTADFDGDAYHFHMTVIMSGKPFDIYQKFLNKIPDTKVNLRFTVQEIAMFIYDEPMGPDGDYLCYRILPIG